MIAVTGAAGHIGNILIKRLLELKMGPIHALVLPNEDTSPLNNLDIEIIKGDILDYKNLKKFINGTSIIYHLASMIAISKDQEELVRRVNIEGTNNVIRACQECKVKKFIYTSSIHALKEPPMGTPITEECGYRPEDETAIYEKTKAEASLAVLKAAKDGLNAVIACPSGVIGPGDYKKSEMGELFIEFINGKLKAYVDGGYNFVDVRDVVDGLLKVAAKGRSGETYLLAGEGVTIKEILNELSIITVIKGPTFKMPNWMIDLGLIFTPLYYKLTKMKPLFTRYSIKTLRSNYEVSSQKAINELGYSYRPIRESIKDHLNWFKKKSMI